MRLFTPVLLLVVVALTLAGARAARAEKAIDWKKRFLTDAPRAWQDYKDLKSLQGVYTLSSTAGEGGKVIGRARAEFKQNKNCVLTQIQYLSKSQSTTLDATNSRYGFQLKRLSPEKPWAITGPALCAISSHSNAENRRENEGSEQ